MLKKINKKKYFLLSLMALLGALFLTQNRVEAYIILMVQVGIYLNHYLMGRVVDLMVETGEKSFFRNRKLFIFVILKMLALVAVLSLGIHFIGNRIIVALGNYVIHIFILSLSIRKISP